MNYKKVSSTSKLGSTHRLTGKEIGGGGGGRRAEAIFRDNRKVVKC